MIDKKNLITTIIGALVLSIIYGINELFTRTTALEVNQKTINKKLKFRGGHLLKIHDDVIKIKEQLKDRNANKTKTL